MARVLAGLTIAGFIELVVAIVVAQQIGGMVTFVAILAMSAVGALITKREGMATWRKFAEGVQAGRVPTDEVVSGGLVVLAGLLLILPGFISGFVALLLLVPATRRLIRVGSVMQLNKRVARSAGRPGAAGAFNFGFGGYRRPTVDDAYDTSSSVRRDEDIIDLDAEVVFLDDPVAELDPPSTAKTDPPGQPS